MLTSFLDHISLNIKMAGKFEPKVPVTLAPPKDDPISLEELAKANGMAEPFALISIELWQFLVV